MVTRGTASRWKPSLQTLQENQSRESNGAMELRPMQGVGNEIRQFGIRTRRRRWVLWTCEEVCNEPTTQPS
jgi:hypothetical protein